MPPFIHHNRPLEFQDGYPILIKARRFHPHDPHMRPRSGLPFLQNLAAGVDRIPLKDGGGKANLVPAEVDSILRDVADGEARDQGQGEGGVDQGAAKFGLGGVGLVEVDGIRVHGQGREPDIIGAGDSSAEGVRVDIPHLKIFVDSSGPAVFDGHGYVSPRRCVSM
jgi:hypothetical protein